MIIDVAFIKWETKVLTIKSKTHARETKFLIKMTSHSKEESLIPTIFLK